MGVKEVVPGGETVVEFAGHSDLEVAAILMRRVAIREGQLVAAVAVPGEVRDGETVKVNFGKFSID